MTESSALVQLDEPIKFRTIAAVEDQLLEMLPESEFTPAQLARIAAVAREKHPDRRTQLVAILDAAAREAAAHPPADDSPALKALDRFRGEYDPQIEVEPGAQHPWLEENRPHWSDPSRDLLGERGSKAISKFDVQWTSTPLKIPLSRSYGQKTDEGGFKAAYVSASLVQMAGGNREPGIRLARLGFYRDGEPVPHHDRARFVLSLDEAAATARALLLLVDAAREEV